MLISVNYNVYLIQSNCLKMFAAAVQNNWVKVGLKMGGLAIFDKMDRKPLRTVLIEVLFSLYTVIFHWFYNMQRVNEGRGKMSFIRKENVLFQ